MLAYSSPTRHHSSSLDYLFAVGSVALAVVVRLLLDPFLGERVPFGTFFVAVMAMSWWTSLKPTLLTLFLSSFASIFLFIEPRYSLSVSDAPFVLNWAIFFAVGLAGAMISEAHRLARSRAEDNAQAALTAARRLETEIEQHQRTLEAYKLKESELKTFIDQAITPIHWIDPSGTIIGANQAELDLLGYTHDEYVGHQVAEFHADRDAVDAILQRLAKDQAVRGEEARIRARDGSLRHVLIYASPYQANGESTYSRWFHHDITERIAVGTVQSRLSAIVEFSDDAIVSKTLDGIVVSWNGGAERMFGYTQDEMLGQSIRRLFPPERLQEEDEFLERLSRGEHIRHYETVRVRKDGQRIDISVTLSPIRDVSGKIVRISKIAQDITERKREERRSRLLLELAAALSRAISPEQIADVIAQHGTQSLGAGVTAVGLLVENDTALELVSSQGLTQSSTQQYRRTPLDMPGPLTDAIHSNDIVWIESREPYMARYPHFAEIIQRNGSHSVISLPLKVNEKIVGGFSFSFPFEKPQTPEEVTFFTTLAYQCAQALERTRLYALVESEHQRLANIVATVPGIIWENEHLDEQETMKLVFVSGYVETMLGYTVEEALAEPNFWFKIFHPDDAQQTAEAFYQVRRSRGSGVINFRAVHKDGSILAIQALMTTILKDGKPVGKRGVMMDVSERQRLLEAQTRYATMLRQSNEELERFASIAAHDLQEPLRMVVSYLQLIESEYISQLDATAHEFFAFAIDGAKRMKEMLNALLNYARVDQEDKPFQHVDAASVLDTALANLTVQIRETNAVITRDELPAIYADHAQITRIFQNLISNSMKFQRPGNQPKIHIGVERKGSAWQFCVRDNGIGIPKEAFNRIFVMMQRLHKREEYAGAGIGLAVSKKIIERHGGAMWVESNLGEGTTFYFTLPVPAGA